MWEYRDGYRDQIFLSSACIHNQHIKYLYCDFVGVRMVLGIGVVGEKHAYFVLNVRCSG